MHASCLVTLSVARTHATCKTRVPFVHSCANPTSFLAACEPRHYWAIKIDIGNVSWKASVALAATLERERDNPAGQLGSERERKERDYWRSLITNATCNSDALFV